MINQNLLRDFKNKPALNEKNLQIIACAGSGKTEFISHRIAYIVAEKIAEPENIDSIYNVLLDVHEHFVDGTLPVPNEKFVKDHDRNFLTKQLTQILQFKLKEEI